MNLDRMNEMQKKAILQTEGPVLLIAGAGSGKTGVLTHRIAHLIEDCGVNGYNILAITFTNKAAKEMRERVDSLVGFGADAAWIMTFHAACVRILRRFIERLGYSLNFTIYDSDDQKTLMKDICKRKNIDTKLYKEKMILSQISKAKDELMSPDEMYMRYASDFQKRQIAELYREYQEQLQKNNAVDFDDIICLTVKLLRKDEEVRRLYQERFRYIMVDEYQDTNTAQFQLVKLLADGHRNLCVVGDDDQSIYKFRGANIMNILNFEEFYPEAMTIRLEQNYRSTGNILKAANAVIKNNVGRKGKTLWTEQEAGEKIAHNVYENGYEEAAGVANTIEELCDREYAYNDIAILYRTNAQSRTLEEKLIQSNIPYRIYGGVNFYSRKEIKDILAYLKTIDNGTDDLAVKRIINVPKRGVGATTINKLSSYSIDYEQSFFDAMLDADKIPTLGKAATKLEPFINLIRTLRAKVALMSVSDLITEIIEQIGYYDYLEENDEPDVASERKENIDELISKAVTYEETVDEPTLSGFLEEVALVADIDNMDEEQNIVSLMTVHAAKGLEFPVVFLTGMEDGLFPGFASIMSDDESELEEERRLCYVAITRAKQRLIISSAKLRMIRGETTACKVSRFVKEIPKEYLVTSAQNLRTYPRNPISNDDFLNAEPRKKGAIAFTSFQRDAVAKNLFGTNSGKEGTELDYAEGDRVKHHKFGEGTVLAIKNGGRDYEVSVEFDTAGVKKMFASFAKLQKI